MECLRISVICLFLCVTKCLTMSLNEIEEFSNFLEKTAQLDEILKKGTSPDLDEYDDDELISDHAWEESGKFEGDLILNERQRRLIVEDVAEGLSRNGLTDSTKRWPDNEVIYYIQKEHFSEDQVDAIQNGIDDLAKASCVKFRPYKKGDRDAVVIQGSRRGCFSQVGYQGGYQVLNLSGRHPVGRGCFRHGTVVHELLHTLGFYHMQSSPDRDDYINVMWDNIIQPAKHNFRKYNSFSVSDFGVGYDYDSVLHYSRRAFSANGQDTLVPKQNGASIGQRVGLSDKDAQKLNKMYCDADNNNEEESPQKAPPKKKKPKNKPFVGHGIGYHQGKAVVIKLPAAETYNLADTPMFHLFDHFSKAPQAVSPATAEGTGVEEKVKYDYDYEPLKYNDDQFGKAMSTQLYADTGNKSNDESRFQYKSNDATFQYAGKKNDSKQLSDGNHKLSKKGEKNSNYVNKDLDEAFETLSKIIKTHVYPSQTPDFDIYKNLDYGPEKMISDMRVPKIENEIEKASEYQTAFPDVDRKTENQKPIVLENKDVRNNHNVQAEQDDVYSIDDGSSETPQNEDHDYNSSYGTSLPFMKFQEMTSSEPPRNEYHGYDSSYETLLPLKKIPEKTIIKPVYTMLQDINDRNTYNGLYELKDMPVSLQSKKNKLYSYIIPFHTKWVNVDKDDIEGDNIKYDHESYTKSKEVDDSSKLVQDERESEKHQLFIDRSNLGDRPYSIIGILVPLTKKWFQVDYNPYSSVPFSVDDSKYNEDYR